MKNNNKQQKKNTKPRKASSVNVQHPTAAPVSISVPYTHRDPKFASPKKGGNRITHCEYVGDFTGGANFAASQLAINPGLSELFPWLSYIAMIYESYMFHSLKFVLVSLRPTSESGQSYLAVDYDAADDIPASKFEMLNYKDASAVAAWSLNSLKASDGDEGALGRRRYVRGGSLPSNLDIKTYDLGNLIVASSGLVTDVVSGSLFVEYDVELFTPQLSASTLANSSSARIDCATSVTKSNIYGTAPVITGGLAVVVPSGTLPAYFLRFDRPGQYLVTHKVTGTGITAGTTVSTSGSTVTVDEQMTVYSGNGGATLGWCEWLIKVTEKGQYLITDYSGIVTTATALSAQIAPYSYDLAY